MAYSDPNPVKLIAQIGSFWLNFYEGPELKAGASASLNIAEQKYIDALNIVASVSRFEIPVFRQNLWSVLNVAEIDLNNDSRDPIRFGEFNFGDIVWDQFREAFVWRVPLPDNGANVQNLINSPVDPDVILTNGVDFTVQDGFIVFQKNPFDYGFTVDYVINTDTGAQERFLKIWAYNGAEDLQYVYQHFGWAVRLFSSESTENYKTVVNAFWDNLIKGSNTLSLRETLAAVTNVPSAKTTGETVVDIYTEYEQLVILTDQNVYHYPEGSTSIVGIGDRLIRGDYLVDTIEIFEDSSSIDVADLQGIAVSGLYSSGPLVFGNKDEPLTVWVDDDGHVVAEFPVGGAPEDVISFWENVYLNGKSTGLSVAQSLRLLPGEGEPALNILPDTVNPLQYLREHILSASTVIIKVDFNLVSFEPFLELMNLRVIIPAHVGLVYSLELSAEDTYNEIIDDSNARADYVVDEPTDTYNSAGIIETVKPSYIC